MIFKNDPFEFIVNAFNELYQGKEYECYWDENLFDEDGEKIFGFIFFPDDGSTPMIFVDANLSVRNAVEILGHELAHLATPNDTEHGEEWKNAFDNIKEKYDEIVNRKEREINGETE